MGIRQAINEQPRVVVVSVIAAVIVIAVVTVIENRRSSAAAARAYKEAFYSDDDGKTWFVDDIDRVPPFDHRGRLAVKATVFRCDHEIFVAYLQKFSDTDKTRIQSVLAASPSPSPAMIATLEYQSPMLAKKPGEGKWLSSRDGINYQRVMSPVCPDGSADLTPVMPADSDNGAAD